MSFTRRHFLHVGAALAAAPPARPAPSDRVGVGFIGCGARAHELIEAVKQHPAAEIAGLVDAYRGRVERARERAGGRAKVYRTYHAVLAQKSIDAVVIAAPDHWHRQMVLDALEAGKDVYVEKPLTYRSSEGLEIIRAARARERMVQVGSQGVSGEAQQKARELIRSGRLGKVTLIRAAYNRNTASGAWIYPIPPDASPQTVDWEMFLGPAPKRPFSPERFFRWRCYEDYSGGIATDLFVHLATTIHYLMDAKMPARAVALGQLYRWQESREVPDTLNGILEYPEGFTVNLSSTFNNEFSSQGGGFQILGTEGTLVLDGSGFTLHPEAAREDNRWIVQSWPKALEEAYYKDPKVVASEVEPARKPRPAAETFRASASDPTVAHIGNFFDSVRIRKPHWEDAPAGHRAAACAHMINQSAKKAQPVEWDFERDDIRGS